MLPAVYRVYAKTRLRCLSPWVDTWALPEMYAGVAQRGAVDVAYQVMADLEYLTLKKIPFLRSSGRHTQIL